MDRTFALWQALHPNSWFEPQTQVTSNYWYKSGTNSSSSAGLKPFKKNAAGDLWTSDDVRNWTVFGYTYPELQPGWTTASVRAAVDSLYSNQEDPAITAQAPQPSTKRSTEKRQILDLTGQPVVDAFEYYINVRASKNALRQPYYIYAFFGDAGPSASWNSAKNLAGMLGIAARLLTCEQAAIMPTVLTTGTIPLNRALKESVCKGELEISTSEDIDSYLKANLNWKVLAVCAKQARLDMNFD